MTTATIERVGRPGHEAVTMSRVIHSEWIKFKSLRSTWISIAAALFAAVVLGILFSALRASHIDQGSVGPKAPTHAQLIHQTAIELSVNTSQEKHESEISLTDRSAKKFLMSNKS